MTNRLIEEKRNKKKISTIPNQKNNRNIIQYLLLPPYQNRDITSQSLFYITHRIAAKKKKINMAVKESKQKEVEGRTGKQRKEKGGSNKNQQGKEHIE